MTHRLAALALAALTLSGCGTFKLASRVVVPPSKTVDGQRLDALVCQNQARMVSQTAQAQSRSFVMGFAFSFVGAAVDYNLQKDEQRAEYKRCLEGLGYDVTSATD